MAQPFRIFMSRKLADRYERFVESQAPQEQRALDDAFVAWHHLFADDLGVNPEIRRDDPAPPLSAGAHDMELLVDQKILFGMTVDYRKRYVRVDFIRVV